MSIFDDKIKVLEQFQTLGIKISLRNTINEHEVEIAEMNSVNQLYELGVDRYGADIFAKVPYSRYTIDWKREHGQPFDHVTLRNSGYFHSTFYVNANNESFEIGAADSKVYDLVRKYGEGILGLTVENLSILVWEILYPSLLENLKSQL